MTRSVDTLLRRRMAEFIGAREGVAAVEFALILPLMLMLYIGTMEASALITMDRKVQTISNTVGDLVARAKQSVTSDEINDYFQAAEIIMTPYPADTLGQIVTLVYVEDGTGEVQWSLDDTGGHPYSLNDTYELPEEITDIANDNYVIVSEASLDYTPLVGIVFDKPIPLYRQNFYMPRFGELIELD